MQQVCPGASFSFREQGNVDSGGEQGGDFATHLACVTAAPALQENGFVLLRQITDQWPAADFGLGDEGGRANRVDDENIEPGNMVGDDQPPLSGFRRHGVHAQRQDVQ